MIHSFLSCPRVLSLVMCKQCYAMQVQQLNPSGLCRRRHAAPRGQAVAAGQGGTAIGPHGHLIP